MKKILGLLFLAIAVSSFVFGQNETFHLTNPTIGECNLIRITPPIRTLSNANAPMGPNYRNSKKFIEEEEEEGQIRAHKVLNPNALPKGISPAVQLAYNAPGTTRNPATLNLQFAGQGFTGVNPSDNNMASGPNHLLQMINNSSSSLIRIWDKAGNILVNSLVLSSITGVSGLGDPVVLYDQLADRWLISEFANVGNHILICVSQTNDPTGSYFVYNYTTPNFPDYFKLATWGNSYIVTSNENSPALYALDRTKMLLGTPTTLFQRFTIPSYPTIGFQSATPVDVTGTTPAPAGSPALFMRMADDAWTTGIVDRLEIFSLNVDWVTPANTTLTGPLLLPTLPFSTNFCGYITFSCIPQQGSSVKLDPLREVLMNKILYRNFGTYESIVCTHIDELDGNSHAGVRWYELRKSGSSPWSIYQQATYGAPSDPTHRWMSCIGINPDNSIGLGYNVAGPNNFPSIRFTGRKDCDPLGQMTEPETTVIAGTSPNASNRYGDYNGMTIDPVDGSFWMTANYNPATQWATRVANFSISPCSGCTPASIPTQPVNATTCVGNNATFTVGAAGTAPLAYQWQLSTTGAGGPWSNVTNGGVYSGAISTSLTITGATAVMNTYQYRCIVTGNCAPLTVTSNAAILTVNAATSVTGQPVNSTICAGANTSFSVTATGTSVTYQWQLSTAGAGGPWNNISNGGVYSTATTATLNITGATAVMNNYQYRCVVSSTCAPLNSAPAILTVNAAPAVTGQPSNITVCAGNAVNFSITATGGGLTYQWQESTTGAGGPWNNLTNVAPYSNVTTATLTINPTAVGMSTYQYRCIVTGACPGTATSNPGILTVGTALSITAQPGDQILCAGSNTSFNVTTSGTVISYQWQLSTAGAGGPWNNITNGGVYNNATTATLNLTGVLASMNTYQYRCVVTGACPAINSNPALLTVNTAPNISAQPVNSTICAIQNTTFNVTATGTAILYQWQVSVTGCGGPWSNVANGGVYTGATSATLTITGAPATMNGYAYQCVINGTCAPAATSSCGLLTVNTAVNITAQPLNSTLCAGANTTFSVTATGTTPTYQWQLSTAGAGGPWNNIANGGVYSGVTTNTLTLTGVTAGMNTYQYRCVVSGTAPCGIVNSGNAILTVNTAPAITINPSTGPFICAGQNFFYNVAANGTALTYQWQESTNGGTNWNNIANGGVYSGATTTTLAITAATAGMNGYQFRCVISGTCPPAATSLAAILGVYTPINITTQPASNTICATGTISFNVAATGTNPGYQWQESTNGGTNWNNIANGGTYSGATTITLTLTGVTAGMNGYLYRALVNGIAPCGNVNSNTATLTVSPQPTVTLAAAPYTRLRPGLPVNPPNISMVTTTITATVTPPTGFTTVWTWNNTPVTVTGNSYQVDLNHLGIYTVIATIGSCTSLPANIVIGDSASSTLWVYPSPNNGQFTVSYYSPGASSTNKTTQSITIYASDGRRVFTNVFTVSQPYQLHQIDLRRNGSDLYYIVLREANGNKIKTGEVLVR